MNTARTAVLSSILIAASAFALPYTKTRYQQSDYFGDFGQNTPLFINPGNITDADQTEIMLGMYSTVNGQAGLEYISGVVPIGYNSTVGASMFIDGATVDATDENAQPGTSKAWRKDAILLGYGYRVLHWLTLGANIQVLNFNNFGDKSNPFAADVGFLLNPFQDSKGGYLKLGASVQNAYQQPGFDNTTNLNTGIHWLGFDRTVEAHAEFDIIDVYSQNGNTVQPQNAWAAGAQYFISPNVALGAKVTREGFPMITFAGNAQRLSVVRYLEVELDISHDGISWNDQKRGLVWNVKLTGRVGPTREESQGAKRYWRLIREPEEAFQAAMRLYLQRKFLESAYSFGRIVVKYPTFSKTDIATYYQGKSLENLQMHSVAKKVYQTGISNYDASQYVPKYYFQLLNIAYKDGNWAEAQTNYNIIASQYRSSEIKSDADYVMGQAYFAQGKNGEARTLLETITKDDANYAYAQYTLGLIDTKEGKLPEAQAAFEAILSHQPRNKSEKDLQEGAAVKLGHVLYSLPQPQLTRAVDLYSQIPSTSAYYDEAQLAAAWCFVRNAGANPKFWDEANAHIANIPESSILYPEGYLVKGYSQLSRKDCGNAAKSFQQVQTLLGKGYLTEEEIKKKRDDYTTATANLPEVSEKVYQLSLQLPSERILDKRAAVQPDVDRIHAAQEEYFKFQDILTKQKKFEKDKARLEKDATYALATAKNCLDKSGSGGAEF